MIARSLLLILATLMCCPLLIAQQPLTQQATAQSATTQSAIAPSTTAQPATAGQAVTFTRRGAVVGDQVEQTITVDLQLDTTARSGQQILDQQQTTLKRDHQRLVTTTQAPTGRSIAATVAYRKADRILNGGAVESEPVAGKTYHCQRDGKTLRITTPEGELPPLSEFQIVALNMESLGVENPLVKFFHGRTMHVGETVNLPVELAGKLLGFEDQLGKATQFSMTLVEVRSVDGRPCAVLKTKIQAASAGNGQMGLLVEGPLVMQIDACRAVSAKFTGPIGMSETHPAPGGSAMQVTGTGKLSVAIRTRYRDAR